MHSSAYQEVQRLGWDSSAAHLIRRFDYTPWAVDRDTNLCICSVSETSGGACLASSCGEVRGALRRDFGLREQEEEEEKGEEEERGEEEEKDSIMSG